MLGLVSFSPVASRVSPRRASYFFLLRQKKVTKKKASHVRAASRSLALLAAFGTLANSLRSNSASVLIRTLLRCSARPNGGGIPLGSSASRTSPEWLVRFAHLAGLVASFLTPHFSSWARHAVPLQLTPSFLTPHFSSWARHAVPLQLTPHSSPLTSHHGQPQGLPLRPHSYDLIRFAHIAGLGLPHSSRLTSHTGTARRATTANPSFLTPHFSSWARHAVPLQLTPSFLTPHIGIGGLPKETPLPHHPACGSAPGGSRA